MKKENLPCLRLCVCLIITIFVMTAFSQVIAAKDLIINGTVVVLHGEQKYNRVVIINSGILYVTHYDGTEGTGMLSIKAKSIFVDAKSSIIANGCGYRGMENNDGEGPGGGKGGINAVDAGGGGAYGGKGGDGVYDYWNSGIDGRGGEPYGDAKSVDINMGSAGGAAGSRDGDYGGPGGSGGGLISLQADSIEILGSVSANGSDGLIYNNDSSGGGSGGGILMIGNTIAINRSLITANGGNGGTECGLPQCILDDGGGGGSGGRIKIFYRISCAQNPKKIFVNGGKGAFNGFTGENGTYYKTKIPVRAVVDIKPDTFNLDRMGNFITAYIELPDNFDVSDIIPTSILLNNAVHAESHPIEIGDYDSDNIPDLMIKFNTRAVISKVFLEYPVANEVGLTIKGKLGNGVLFIGTDKVKIVINRSRH